MKILSLVLVFITLAFSMDKPAYMLYNDKGKKADYQKMIKRLSKADIVLFGELHDNALVHWLQLQIIKDINQADRALMIGAEMFEADDQLIIDEYLQGLIEARHLENEAKIWDNYTTDYKPLLEFAKQQHYSFIATNIPRRYASLVSRIGLDSLENISEKAKTYMAPLPIEVDLSLPAYQNMMQMMGGGHGKGSHGGMSRENMVKAQAIKDATMAHFILRNLKENNTFVHFNGSYHSDHFEGIYWYLKQAKPELDIVTLSSVEQEDITVWNDELDSLANYVISIPTDMTKTY